MVENLLNWISANPHWAGLAVFSIAFLESLAIVGLAVPGWLLLVGVGSLIGGGHLNFWLISLASFTGAALGQVVSYSVGFYFKDRIHHWPWVQRHQSMLSRAEDFFKRHGFAGILVGQFIGPIRAVISLIAGILAMPVKRFVIAVILATLIWAPAYLMPGVVVGAALTFDKQQVWILLSCIILMAMSLWLMGRFLIDQHKAKKSEKELPAKRRWVFISMLVLLASIISFLGITDYGGLMVELGQKIWELIS